MAMVLCPSMGITTLSKIQLPFVHGSEVVAAMSGISLPIGTDATGSTQDSVIVIFRKAGIMEDPANATFRE